MKNSISFLLLGILPALCLAQPKSNFSITGHIGNLNAPAKAYIDYMDNGVSHEDSVKISNGTFTFTGHVSGISYARMAVDHDGGGKMKAVYTGDVAYFYFGKENVKITSKDSLSNAVFTGSKVYDEYVAYNKIIGGTAMQLAKNANADFAKGTPEQQKDSLYLKAVDARYRQNMANRTARQFQYAKDNPNSYFGLVALSESIGDKFDPAKVEAVYNALNPELRKTDVGKELEQRIYAAKNISVGSVAPVFTQTDVNGKPLKLSDLRGKYVLIDFWASWCSPCRAENPNLIKQYKIYKDKGFEILSVSLDSYKDKWTDAIRKDGMPWLHVSDLKGWNNAVGRLYGIRAVPQSFLIDKNGKIIAVNLRGEALGKKLAEVFGE
ncbi:AhpC/TSA family protein [Mucilaginibacter sp. RS28]|uniref:AhpC/TSA family protein n=1 Tax=Mucilaginibacter straminoryzae TaxID=2932774 RepID=A0A9X1X1S2_9SPHI|nr:TlpA disulfide reductase family protein [Mucilaginibacter straminoryzae]MCJ8209574.1 AhpC/TSA family protein [Mucilaginibacter straminoryzae]